jgi:hypothetical protein
MAHERTNDQNCENRARVREILMQKRDPIGISRICLDNEYDRYIGTIYAMLVDEHTDHQRITNHLHGLAITAMGLSNGPRLREKCDVAADALLALRAAFATRKQRG